jgi:hypothetical protein
MESFVVALMKLASQVTAAAAVPWREWTEQESAGSSLSITETIKL